MINHKKVSLVIPFYNEENNICKTFKNIMDQTTKPDEIIFVDSYSKDNSVLKLRLFIQNYNLDKKKIKLLTCKKRLPSSSKNLGIRNAEYNNVCFTDVGLSFNNFFISSVKNKISSKKFSYVQGKYFFKPKKFYDKLLLSQTYGIFTHGDCIPLSCFKKDIFNKYGFFENFRSGYDRVWLKNIKNKNLFYNNNFRSTADYLKYNSGNNLVSIFKKIFFYSQTTVGLKKYYLDKLYILFFLVFCCMTYIGLFLESIFIYLIYRGILIPSKKNYKNLKIKKDLSIFIFGPVIGLIIDLSRLLGFIFGYFKKIIK
jgi:glycosyltransferase involved in cell wall biosynthesis